MVTRRRYAKTQTHGGDFINATTRFWLSLTPAYAAQLLIPYLLEELGENNVMSNNTNTAIRVSKSAGHKSVIGTFVLKASDAVSEEGGTLVMMKREKVSLGCYVQLMAGLDTALESVLVGCSKGSADRAIRRQGGQLNIILVNTTISPAYNIPNLCIYVSIIQPTPAAAAHPASTIPVVSQGFVGRTTLSPNPAAIPPRSLVPAQIRSVVAQTA